MSLRTIAKITASQLLEVGPMRVRQPLPTKEAEQVSPFLLLHHAGPDHYSPHSPVTRLSPHPHRGFEPVTFLFSGGLHHKDSLGNEGLLQAGDVQWMTAGSGIIHSEGPSREFVRAGGDLELVQLWVNLPRDHKMTTPKYQNIKKEEIPTLKSEGIEVKVVAGTFKDLQGPAVTFTPITALMVYFEGNKELTFDVPTGYNALIYLLEGAVDCGGQLVEQHHLAIFNKEGESLSLHTQSGGKMLFLHGAPINEPLASYGPFVMNYPGEIKQAILDYDTGRMGKLES